MPADDAMRNQDPDLVEPEAEPNYSGADESGLRVASPTDETGATARADRLDSILRGADVRDRAAERRDRDAERRDLADGDRHGALDRDWAGRDRDRAAEDRADLLALLRSRKPLPEPGAAGEPGPGTS